MPGTPKVRGYPRADDEVILMLLAMRDVGWSFAAIGRRFKKTTGWAKNTYDRVMRESAS